MRKIVPFLALAAALPLVACDSFGQAMTAHTDLVARAGGHELTIDRTAALLIANPRVPAQPDVVEAVANLWIDYVLLATAVNEDSTLKALDLQPLVRPALEQEMVLALRDKVIKVDTLISDAELQRLYSAEQPGAQIKARHILLRMEPDATPGKRDSVMALAKTIREQASRPGADFAALAKRYTEEPGGADRGGDLGFFARGQMVKPFEDAAFALQPGQVSDVVQTPFGYHVIKLEERKVPPLSEVRAQFLQQARTLKQQQAEEAYVKQLTDPLSINIEEGAFEVARDLAKKPDMKMGGRAESRDLVSYKGGSVGAGEYRDLMRSLPAQRRGAFGTATDDQLKPVLEGLARNEVLIVEARKLGLEPSAAKRDSMTTLARTQLHQAIESTGLKNIQPQEGESRDQAIERKATAMLEAVVKGEQAMLPLGPLSYVLREKYDAQVFERAFPEVVTKVEAGRPKQPPVPGGAEGPPAGQAPPPGQGAPPQPQAAPQGQPPQPRQP
jgi:peptidyl-prolyl cis-trans isomerase C